MDQKLLEIYMGYLPNKIFVSCRNNYCKFSTIQSLAMVDVSADNEVKVPEKCTKFIMAAIMAWLGT